MPAERVEVCGHQDGVEQDEVDEDLLEDLVPHLVLGVGVGVGLGLGKGKGLGLGSGLRLGLGLGLGLEDLVPHEAEDETGEARAAAHPGRA